MHLLLTDRLSCPRCGPKRGLILLADTLEDRRVVDGVLGCPNCRDGFPVRGGFADLRAPPRGPLAAGRAGDPVATDAPDSEWLTALLGVTEGPGTIMVMGELARHGGGLAFRVPGVEVVALDADMVSWPETERVSRMVARPGIPFFSLTLRGVGVDGALGMAWIEEAARVTARLGRVVVAHAPDGTEEALTRAGLTVLVAEGGTVVAARG